MAIKGSLNEASLPDIIQLLSIGLKTGVLSITNRQNFGNIYLKNGNVIFANIVNREDRIGEILLRRNRLTQDALDKAIAAQQKSNNQKMLGTILVELEFITEGELIEHLEIQIEEAIHTLLTWRDGFFVFEPNRVPEEDVPTVSIRTSKLVMEAARRIDEWEVMRKKIPSLDMIVKVVNKDGMDVTSLNDLNCSEEEWRILSFVNNERSIHELADLSSVNEFDVAKVIYGLMTSGLIEIVEPLPHQAAVRASDTRITESHNLGLAFLKADLYEEARKEYSKILELQPDDQTGLFYQGLVSFQLGDFEDAIVQFEKCLQKYSNSPPSLFNNLAVAYEKKGDLEKSIFTLEKGLEKNSHHQKMQINLGRNLIKSNDLKRARAILENAKNRDPKQILPRFYLAIVCLKLEAFDEAFQLFHEISHDKKNEVIYNNEGFLLEILGKNKDAIDSYKKALKTAPNLLQARQSLADIYYRNGWHQDALAEYEKIVEIYPSSSEAFFKIGNIYMKYHEQDKALIAWEKSLELDSDNELLRRNINTVKKLKLVN